MSIVRPKLTGQIRIGRPRRAADNTVEKMDTPLSARGVNLVYAGYPYDPYAEAGLSGRHNIGKHASCRRSPSGDLGTRASLGV